MMEEQKREVIPAPEKKPAGIKEFFEGALGPFRSRDLSQAVEEFTSEMALVAEGLSEDQESLRQEVARVSAQQTILEEAELERLHDIECAVQENADKLAALESKLDKLEKLVADKKIKKVEGWTGLIRQATWLCGILAGAWIIVTVIQFFQ